MANGAKPDTVVKWSSRATRVMLQISLFGSTSEQHGTVVFWTWTCRLDPEIWTGTLEHWTQGLYGLGCCMWLEKAYFSTDTGVHVQSCAESRPCSHSISHFILKLVLM